MDEFLLRIAVLVVRGLSFFPDFKVQLSVSTAEQSTSPGFWNHFLSSDFMPHGHCYFWDPGVLWLQVLSNAFVALAYFSIPAMVFYFIRRRSDLPFHWLCYLFAAFILCCGVTHVMDIIVIWHPVYRIDGILRAITAAVSVLTAILLFPVIPKALALKSPKELEAKNIELDAAYQKLQASEKLKDEFLAKVSHELRTPLTLIMAPVESMLDGDSGSCTPAQQEALKTVRSNSVRLLQMVTSLLDFSKLGAGKVEVKRQPTDIVLLTESLFKEFQGSFSRKKIKAVLHTDIQGSVVDVDPYLYERILFNLLSNAVKFTPQEGKIEVRLQFTSDRLHLSVKDSGVGMTAEDRATLFQKFHQLESTVTRRFEGTGLGLALVKEFVTLLSGQISVESEPGKGSTFVVEFSAPRSKQVAHEAPPHTSVYEPEESVRETPRPKTTAGALHGTVLVAEDNPELSKYICSILSGFCETRAVQNGQDALELAKRWKPDLILSDVMMPQMDGFSLCKAIKGDPKLAHIPVVLLTALTYRESLIKGWESGADEYLFKPFHPKELVTRIQSLLKLIQERKLRELEKSRREELEEFSHIASHDLKEPLRTVTTYSQMIKKLYGNQLDDHGDQYIGFVIDSARRMQQLLDDLINYSVVSRKDAEFGPVSSQNAVNTAMQNLESAIRENNAEITCDELPEVAGNHSQLVSLFQNLLSNALKYRSADRPKIHVGAARSDDQWLFSVKDNGIGFEPQYAEHVFVIFKRLHDRKHYPGTGMGLAICRKIVERHQGKIWAESKLGEGSSFFFTLNDRAFKFEESPVTRRSPELAS